MIESVSTFHQVLLGGAVQGPPVAFEGWSGTHDPSGDCAADYHCATYCVGHCTLVCTDDCGGGTHCKGTFCATVS